MSNRGLLALFAVFFSQLLFAVDPPPRGPKNAHCRIVLEDSGYATVKDWMTAKVEAIEALGIPRDKMSYLAGITRKHFDDLLSGKVTNLGTESTKKLQRFFETMLTPAEQDVRTVNGKLTGILARLDPLPDVKARQRMLYADSPDAVPIAAELAAKTENIDLATKHYLTDVKTSPGRSFFGPDVISGTLGKHTFRAHEDPRERWLQTDFEANTRPGVSPVKVYINVPQNEALGAEAERMANLAEKHGAGAFKFNAVSRYNLPDRMVAYFATPEAAFEFAQAAAKDLKERGVSGDGVPFAFRVGNSPVSLGVDPDRSQSWRGKVTTELAYAHDFFATQPNRAELTRRYLLTRGIDPDTWLPVSFVQKNRDRLTALGAP